MELINNTTKTLRDDLAAELKEGSRLSIAAACFSIYAFQELKEELQKIEELRFIFTSPTFTTEKAKKEKREFYIPRLNRERSLYGTEFEIKLRNELSQKAIARECAEWIRQKATFKSNNKLTDDIFFMLNNVNIRHNNCAPEDRAKYKEYVAAMNSDQLEAWYDELYQMILLAFLLLDNEERAQKVSELKDNINRGKKNGQAENAHVE